MPGKSTADVVFCLDASSSMRPCFDRVRRHVGDFMNGLSQGNQSALDMRLEFIAHSAAGDKGPYSQRFQSVFNDEALSSLYGHTQSQSPGFFTDDASQFKAGLDRLSAVGDESPLFALDVALDLPWRNARECHRVVILMTDEPFETGAYTSEQAASLEALMDKIEQLRVMLYLVAPDSPGFMELAAVDKCEYEVVEGGAGLESVDFAEVLAQIGHSVSVSSLQAQVAPHVDRALYGQDRW